MEDGKTLERWQEIRSGNPGNPLIIQIQVQTLFFQVKIHFNSQIPIH
jgi:hypothetical protein